MPTFGTAGISSVPQGIVGILQETHLIFNPLRMVVPTLRVLRRPIWPETTWWT